MTPAEQALFEAALNPETRDHTLKQLRNDIAVEKLERDSPELVKQLVEQTVRCRVELDVREQLLEKLKKALKDDEYQSTLTPQVWSKRWSLHLQTKRGLETVAELEQSLKSLGERYRENYEHAAKLERLLEWTQNALGA